MSGLELPNYLGTVADLNGAREKPAAPATPAVPAEGSQAR
jgi:hypothetical protein